MNQPDLKEIIADIFAGEWDRSHEWTTKYDYNGRIEKIAALLENWRAYNEGEQDLVAHSLLTMACESYTAFGPIAALAVEHADKEAVVQKLMSRLQHANFAGDILNEMLVRQCKIGPWLQKIKEFSQNKELQIEYFETDQDKVCERVTLLVKKVEELP